eukprot:gene2132-2628_t
MKDTSIIIPTVNLTGLNRSPSSSNPCSPSSKSIPSAPFEYDGCMLCTNGTPSCLQKRRATWTLKLRVALFCLSVLHPEKKYFNLKKDIYTYVDSHWDLLSINTAKSDRWRKQVQDSLSHCRHFESGWDAMGCNGHWRLIQPLNPWSFPPDKESQIYEDEESCFTPESGLSPRTTKSPREDPLYRNFPKRRTFVDEESENRKRKGAEAHDLDRFTEEDLLLLKYSPMIFSDTPSPKCRTPRSNNSSSTSPSIIGNSPLLTSSGTYFSLANFNNNLTLNSPSTFSSNNPPPIPMNGPQQFNHHNSVPQVNGNPSMNNSNNGIQIYEPSSPSSTHSPPILSSPRLNPSERSYTNNCTNNNSPPPIPTTPFSWKNGSSQSIKTGNGCGEESFKIHPLPNPFTSNGSTVVQHKHENSTSSNCKITSNQSPSIYSISNNSNLKVPSDLLLKSSNPVTTSSTNNNNTSSINNNNNSNTNSNSKLTKLQQQNLILNCTY